jgi:hypothetical protein
VKPISHQTQQKQQSVDPVEAEPSVPLPQASAGEIQGTSIEDAPKEDAMLTEPQSKTAIPAAPESAAVEVARLSLPQPEASDTRAEQLAPQQDQIQTPEPCVGALAAAELASGGLVEQGAFSSEATLPAAPEPALQGGVQSSTPQREDQALEFTSKEAKPTVPRVSTVASPQRCGDSPNNLRQKASRATTSMVTVTFSVPYPTTFGEEIAIVGNKEALGEWDPSKAVAMRWTDGHIWVTTIELELPPAASGEFLEYK